MIIIMSPIKNDDFKQTYRIHKQFDQLFTGNRIEVDSSGQFLISPCYNSLNFIQIETGQRVKEVKLTELDLENENEDYIVTFAFNDNHLVIVYSSGLLRHWSVRISGSNDNAELDVQTILQRTWKSLHVGQIASIRFDTTSSLVATGGSDSSIKIWDIVNNCCTHNFKEAKGVINTISFSPTFTNEVYYLLGSGDDYLIHVWNLIDSKHLAALGGHDSKITSIVFTDNGTQFISSSRDKLLIVWNVGSFEKARTIAAYESIETTLLVPREKIDIIDDNMPSEKQVLVTAGESGVMKVWDYKTGNILFTQTNSMFKVDRKSDDDVANNDDEEEDKSNKKTRSDYTLVNQLIYNEKLSQLIAVSFDKDIIFHDIADLSSSRQLVGHNDEILDIKLIGEQQTHIAVATNSPKIKIFEIESSNCYMLLGHTDIVLSLAIFPQNPYLMVSSSKDNSIRLWQFSADCLSAICLFTGTGHTHSVTSLAVSMPYQSNQTAKNSELFFLSGSEDTTLKFWKLQDNIESFDSNQNNSEFPCSMVSKYTQSCHEKAINTIDVSPNNQIVATGSQDKTVKLWILPHLKLIGVIRGHKKGIWFVQFSPVDQVLASCSADTTIKIWSISDFACLKTFQGHTSSVLRMNFIDHGMQFISSSSDGNIKIWNLKSNECVNTIDGHEGKVWALAKSNDDEMIVTGDDDSKIIVWRNNTTEAKEKDQFEKEETIQSEQAIQNLIQKRSWFKALKVSIRMAHPFRSLKILKEMLLERSNIDELVAQLCQLRQDQLLTLLEYCVHWNTNSKHYVVAHCVIRAALETIPASELLQMPDFKAKVERILPYCERHMTRVKKLQQYATFADFVYENMKLPDAQESS